MVCRCCALRFFLSLCLSLCTCVYVRVYIQTCISVSLLSAVLSLMPTCQRFLPSSCGLVLFSRSDGPCSDLSLHRLSSQNVDDEKQQQQTEQQQQQQQTERRAEEAPQTSSSHGVNIVHTDSTDSAHGHVIKVKR